MTVRWKAFPILSGEIKALPITEHSIRDRRNASRQEPRAKFVDWGDPDRPYVTTSMRSLEAAKCAARQGDEMADRYHWALYRAFFAQARDVSDPGVLVQVASESGLDTTRFAEDFVAGVGRKAVLGDYHEAIEYWGALTQGVPLVIVGIVPMVGSIPEESYTNVIEYVRRGQEGARALLSGLESPLRTRAQSERGQLGSQGEPT